MSSRGALLLAVVVAVGFVPLALLLIFTGRELDALSVAAGLGVFLAVAWLWWRGGR